MSPTPTPPDPAADSLAARLEARFGPASRLVPLDPDASVRRFFRLSRWDGATRIVLVDADGGVRALARMCAAHETLSQLSLRVPALVDRDDELCALVFEDLGDTLLAAALPTLDAAAQVALYAEAGRAAGRIALHGTAVVGDGHPLAQPRLGRSRLRIELALFLVHDIAGRRDLGDTDRLRQFGMLLDQIAETLAGVRPQLAHRDFHARNLMWLAAPPPGGPQLGIVDFQDTLFAPPYYDLVSLVRDPYVVPGPELERAAIDAYAAAAGLEGDPLEDPLFHWAALQRDLKAIGTYAFQARRLGRTRFLEAIPAAERLARRAADALPRQPRALALSLFDRCGFAT